MNDEAAQDQQHLDRGREPGQERRERVDQDAVGQHAAAAEAVGQVAAEQAEDAAGERRDVEQPPDPHLELGRAGHGAGQLEQRRPHDQRQHQEFVDVEREADRGDGADQPLDRRQRCWSRIGSLHVLHCVCSHAGRLERVIKFTSRWFRSSSSRGRGWCSARHPSSGPGTLARELGFRRTLLVADPGIVAAGHAATRSSAHSRPPASTVVRYSTTSARIPTARWSTAGRALCRAARASTRIVALGGGSSLDCAKGINFLLTNGGDDRRLPRLRQGRDAAAADDRRSRRPPAPAARRRATRSSPTPRRT